MVVGPQFKNVLIQTGAQASNLLIVLLLMRAEDSNMLGIFGIARSVFGLLEYSHGGTRYGIDLKYSLGDSTDRFKMLDTSYKTILGIGFLVSYFFFIKYDYGIYFSSYILSTPFILVVNAYRLSLRAANDIDSYLRTTFFYNTFLSVGGLLLILFGGLDLYLGGVAVLNLGIFMVYYVKRGIVFRSSWIDLSVFKFLSYNGLPLFIFGLAMLLILNIERYIYVQDQHLQMQSELTVYLMFIGLVSVVPNAIIEIVQTRLIRLVGSESSSVVIQRETIKKLLISTVSLVLIAIPFSSWILKLIGSLTVVNPYLLFCAGFIAFLSSTLSLRFFGAYKAGAFRKVIQAVIIGLSIYILTLFVLAFIKIRPTVEIMLILKLFVFIAIVLVGKMLKWND